MSKASQEVTVREAAEMSGYNPESIRRLLRGGALTGRLIATVWLVDVGSLRKHMKQKQSAPRGPRQAQKTV